MQIIRIRIADFEGLEAVEVSPGKATLVSGKNKVGKTSFLQAVEVALANRGRNPRLVRDGAGHATVLVELSDGTVVSRTLTEGEKATELVVEKGTTRLSKPQSLLDDLFGRYSFNPVDFLLKSSQEQAQELLGLVELEVSEDRWEELSGGELRPEVDYSQTPLVALQSLEKALYDERTGVNREAKTQQTLVQEIQGSLPLDFDPEPARQLDLESLTEQLQRAEVVAWQINDLQKTIAVREATISARKEELRVQIAAKRLEEEELAVLVPVDAGPLLTQIHEYEQQKARLRQYEQAEEAVARAKELDEEGKQLTLLIREIRREPGRLLSQAETPIEDLSISEDGEVMVWNRLLASLSSSEQLRLALAVARATCGELKVLFLDGIERLDAEAQAELQRQAQEDEFQYFVTRVGRGELEVKEWEVDE
jgi:hypothetical protein